MHDSNNHLHGDRSDEWDLIHVQCDRDECFRHRCGLVGVSSCRACDGSGCADRGFWDFECERIVGCVLDCAGLDRWCCDLQLHGDLDTGFVHVYDGNNVVHGDGVDERDHLHVQCDCDECVGYWCGFGVGCCGSVDGSGCADRGERDWCCEHPVGGDMDCTRKQWWCFDLQLHGDVDTGFVHVHDGNNVVRGDGSHEWDELHVQCDCDECQWHRLCFVGLGCCCSFHGAWCSDRGERDWCCEHPVGCVLGCPG